jgi:hypothetical protein
MAHKKYLSGQCLRLATNVPVHEFAEKEAAHRNSGKDRYPLP